MALNFNPWNVSSLLEKDTEKEAPPSLGAATSAAARALSAARTGAPKNAAPLESSEIDPTVLERLAASAASAAPGAGVSAAPVPRLRSNVEVLGRAGLNVSTLKTSSWLGWIANNILTADIFRSQIGWAKPLSANAFGKEVVSKFSNKTNLAALVGARTTGRNVAAVISDEELGRELHSLIFTALSPLSEAAKLMREGSSEKPDLISKYSDISQWFPAGAAIPTPSISGLRKLLTLTDVYIAAAMQDKIMLPGPVSRKNNPLFRKVETSKEVINIISKTLKEPFASKTTAQGEKAADAAQKAIDQVRAAGERIFTSGFSRLSTILPPGSHIAYQFMGGALHHGVYLGSNVVIEVMNLETSNADKLVKGFITVNTLDDFVKRCRNNVSELFVYSYDNPYPLDVLKARTLWSLGRFPNYNVTNENCDSFANWVFENDFSTSVCIVTKRSKVLDARERAAVIEGISPEVAPVGDAIAAVVAAAAGVGLGGGSRRRSQRNKRHRRRTYRK